MEDILTEEIKCELNVNEELLKLRQENENLRQEKEQLKTSADQLRSDLKKMLKLIKSLEDIKAIGFSIANKCKCGQTPNNNVNNELKKLKTRLNISKSVYDQLKKETTFSFTNDLHNETIYENSINSALDPDDDNVDQNSDIHEEDGVCGDSAESVSDAVNKKKLTRVMPSRKVKKKRGRKPKVMVMGEENSLDSKSMKKTKRCQWPGCEAVFRDRIDLENHMWRHTGEKLYACDWPGCGKQFASKCIMRKHQETHLDPQRFKCEFTRCSAAFVNSDELEQHFKDIHDGLKPYTCHWPNCHKQCSSKLNLQKHHYSHKEPKKFKCQWTDCNESYVKRNQLMAHECKAHTGVKPFKCDWPGCDYEACYEQTLKNHQLRHTDDKPYKCSWPKCEWSFRRNDHLKVHMLKHTGEKPFGCDWPGCDRRFQTRQTLKIHVEKTHGNN